MNVKIKEVAIALPSKKVDNKHFESYLETNDEWIKQRTGISSRYFCENEESSLSLAIESIKNLKSDLSKVDGIVVASMSSIETCPTISSQLANIVNDNENIFTMDVNVGCSGFIHAFLSASSLIESNICSKILVVGTEQMSKIIDHDDRSTSILFGDAAGSVLLEKSNKKHISNVVTKTRSNYEYLHSKNNQLKMNGQQVFKFAVKEVSDLINTASQNSEIDYLLLHQANSRIIESVSKRTKIDISKFVVNVDKYGNTSAASIILALHEIFNNIKEKDKLLMCGFGAGLTWGGFIYEH